MNRDIMTWLAYMVVSPIAVLALVAFLLGACAPVDPCPDLRCDYEYGGEAPAPSPEPEPEPEPEKGDKGDRGDKGHDKGDRDGGDD